MLRCGEMQSNSKHSNKRRRLRTRSTSPVPESVSLGEEAPAYRNTFRVRGVPIDWDIDRLQIFLADHAGSPVVGSLATETHGFYRTATVTFQPMPLAPEILPDGKKWSICLPERTSNQIASNNRLSLDDAFHGITTLYTPLSDDHQVE